MDARTLLDEIEETIARIETLNRAQKARRVAPAGGTGAAARRLFKSRQSRLAWLRQVRAGILAEKPKTALLH